MNDKQIKEMKSAALQIKSELQELEYYFDAEIVCGWDPDKYERKTAEIEEIEDKLNKLCPGWFSEHVFSRLPVAEEGSE